MLRYRIPAMTCGGCARAVTRTVQGVAGPDTTVEIDLATREVRIGTDAAREAALQEALAGAGYPAERCEVATSLG